MPKTIAPAKVQGKVTRIRPEVGYGFIVADIGEVFFFHFSRLESSRGKLFNGCSVEFDTAPRAEGKRYSNAVNVRQVWKPL